MLSNRNLSIIALLLFIGVIGDGVLYNRPIQTPSVYPIKDARTIEINYQGNVLLALRKADDKSWLVTTPFHAPAIDTRVALLLAANDQTSRSYTENDLAVRGTKNSNPGTDVTVDQLFSDPVELKVDDHAFILGALEPVSQLRYVAANKKIYLQADYVVPLLQSPKSTFTDLTITETVSSVSIATHSTISDKQSSVKLVPGQERQAAAQVTSALNTSNSDNNVPSQALPPWQNLDALAVIDAELLEQLPMATVIVERSQGTKTKFHISRYQQLVALRPEQQHFAYLVSEEQAEKLGICVYC